MNKYYIISNSDNVATALTKISAGEEICGSIIAASDIPANFKFALKDIRSGNEVIKYAASIGVASKDIAAGEVVHSHNLKTALSGTKSYSGTFTAQIYEKKETAEFFQGYKRKSGKAGVRNDIYIVPTVGCVNSLCESIAKKASEHSGYRHIFALPHPYGCSQLGSDHEDTQKILSRLVMHPNAGGVLVVSLGCENNHLGEFKTFLNNVDGERVLFMTAQDSGDELEEGLKKALSLVDVCKADKREPINIKELVIGLKCGGSDALSGITANPLLGTISDRIVAAGGTALLTEVPEMFGAEHLLMDRSASYEVRSDIIKMVNDFKEYYISHGEPVGENPSPGNKEGGITTLEEKSLGCIQKGGFAPVTSVCSYGGEASKGGLVLLNAPGNDIVAQTALSAAGAHIILFTTGRGTPLGAPVPTVKVSTNNLLNEKKPNWIDFNAGGLVTGENKGAVSQSLWELIIETASGKETRNEINGYRDIAVWKKGVTL